MRTSIIIALTVALCGVANAAAPVPNCKDPQSNLEMKMCASRELTQAEGELKIALDRAVKAAEEQYASVRAQPGFETMPNMPAELRKAQHAWEVFRDANCDYQNLVYYGGTMASLAVIGCRRDMTKARTKELRDLIQP
jgi:uncharacterized protein YecT (DUF1311 family)